MGKMKAGTFGNETSAQRMARDKRYNRGAALTLSIAKKICSKKSSREKKEAKAGSSSKKNNRKKS